jgi:predicted AAA+ superfamily ATPase
MTVKARYLKEKMVFLGGPRQVGKTTAATDLIANSFKSSYYNRDKISNRRTALKGDWPVIEEDGQRLENFGASHLLKYCHYLYSYGGFKVSHCLHIRPVHV